MQNSDQVYVQLQKHLDNQAVGFPSTRSGAEIKILKHIFTPQEAVIATCLNYRMEPLDKIFELWKAKNQVKSRDELKDDLFRMVKKGGIERKQENDQWYFCTAPLIVGMYEYQGDRLTPEFVDDFNEYIASKRFGIEFLSTELPQMRTIPVAESIEVKSNVSNFDEVLVLLKQAEPPFAIVECICRKKKEMEEKCCSVTKRKETCLAVVYV